MCLCICTNHLCCRIVSMYLYYFVVFHLIVYVVDKVHVSPIRFHAYTWSTLQVKRNVLFYEGHITCTTHTFVHITFKDVAYSFGLLYVLDNMQLFFLMRWVAYLNIYRPYVFLHFYKCYKNKSRSNMKKILCIVPITKARAVHGLL